MKVLSVVGARPQFVKAAALSRKLRERHDEVLVHTGQHYDHEMSGAFFESLGIPPAEHNLGVGSGSHGVQTGEMLKGIEEILVQERPDWMLVYGDTNSTLAGALAASKLHVPVVHVEAGLRSFNRRMPEEINRVMADHLSSLLFCPSQTAVDNLAGEGIREHVHIVGDVMLDVLNRVLEVVRAEPPPLIEALRAEPGGYLLLTVHRSDNTDDPVRLAGILGALEALDERILFPAHPRTRKVLAARGWQAPSNIDVIDPVGYLEMVELTRRARLVLTDSGGLQKEAYWLGVPCLTLRDETEWVEVVEAGWNRLVGTDAARIVAAVRTFEPPAERPAMYGDGRVAERCVDLLTRYPR